MEARLPQDKLPELSWLLRDNMQRKKIRFKDLQAFEFACKVTKPGRCFLKRLYDLTYQSHRSDHFIKLNIAARADLKVWASFLEEPMVALLSLAISSFYQIPCNLIQMQLNVRGLLASFSKFGLGVLSQVLLSNFIKKVLELYPITLAVYLSGSH